ncbi:NAD-dependent epimerase/dehydratase family protein [bacterium CPR1]|nr:NAD-dependent epimerase/dehydratase family protein [bacterium CPR1]
MGYELLTGATGLLGSYLLRDALRAGKQVAVLARRSRTLTARELGWNPTRADLTEIVRSAWEWHCSHPNGYRAAQVAR